MLNLAFLANCVRAGGIAALALIVAGCFSSGSRPPPVTAAPSQPVRTADLPPPQVTEPQPPIADQPLDGEAAPEQEVAAASPPQGLEIGRTDLLGGWSLAAGGETCQLFMSLTTWTGGYRASTRGCSSPNLATISSWDLNDNTVVLKGGEGAAPVASLVATAGQTFSGQLAGGGPVTVSR